MFSDRARADINVGFIFGVDALATLFIMGGVLNLVIGLPADIVFGRIIPGVVLGILVANIAQTMIARRLREKTGNPNVTALPIGADVITILAVSFVVIAPVYFGNIEALGPEGAADAAWKVGMATTIIMGIVKAIAAFLGPLVIRAVPRVALLGSLSAVAIVWLGADAFYGTLELPVVGMITLVIMLYGITAHRRLPFGLPGAAAGVIVGSGLFFIMAATGIFEGYVMPSVPPVTPVLPVPTFLGFTEIFGMASQYIGVVAPLGILAAVFGMNVVAGAQTLGDEYDSRQILLLDSGATLLVGLFGGMAQTINYGGHATFRRLGGGTNYPAYAAIAVAIIGFLGLIALGAQMIPRPVLLPILIVVAADIVLVSVVYGKQSHAPAFMVAVIPAIFNYGHVKLTDLFVAVSNAAPQFGTTGIELAGQRWFEGYVLLGALSNGYILTGLLWGAIVAWIIDGQLRQAAGGLFVCAVFSFFGVIHSVVASASAYFPWNLSADQIGSAASMPYQFASAYIAGGVLLLLLQPWNSKDDGIGEELTHDEDAA